MLGTFRRLLRHPGFLFFISSVLCLVVIDAVIMFFELDTAAASKTAYHFEGNGPYADLEIYCPSKDAERLYELFPGYKARGSQLRRSDDIDTGEILFSIDRFGFRSNGGPERTKEKPDGVFRIIAVGGSNTFGFCVSDSQTWPAQLEKVLNTRFPGRFEVWNAGLSSYSMTQKIAYAELIIKEYEPDLLLFQHYNFGRRAFLVGSDYDYFFRRNKDLWCENIPLIWFDSENDVSWHQFLVRNWALYRVVLASYNNFLISRACKNRLAVDFSETNLILSDYFSMCFNSYSDKLMLRKCRDFIAQVRKKGFPRLAMIVNMPEEWNELFDFDLPRFFIENAVKEDGKSEEYSDIHPPSQGYEWYGEKIADWLIKEKLISGHEPEHKN